MSEDIFYRFLDDNLKENQDIIWLTSIIFHERYKYKYNFECYDEDLWINKLDKSMSNKEVKECLLNDIDNLINDLLLYNEKRENNYINIIINKLKDNIFIKSVTCELRELFYHPM
jgi:hypothetical protein